MIDEYSILKILPDDGEKCLAFGHKTFCCIEDMDEKPDWHEVVFKFVVSSYKIKERLPEDIEDSVLESCKFREIWMVNHDDDLQEHLIGVIKWKKLRSTENTGQLK